MIRLPTKSKQQKDDIKAAADMAAAEYKARQEKEERLNASEDKAKAKMRAHPIPSDDDQNLCAAGPSGVSQHTSV